MSDKIIQFDDAMFESKLDALVRVKVEQTINAMLDAEADEIANTARYERKTDRKAFRAGHYERTLTAKAGKLSLKMPKLKGALFGSAVIERYRRRESSVEEALMEMYLAGVSTRRVDDISQLLWGERMPSQTLSDKLKKIYKEIDEWRKRPLESEYPYVFVDGVWHKRSWGGHVENVSVLVAIGVSTEGRREVIAVDEGMREDAASWEQFFRSMIERGLRGVRLVVGDRCAGLVSTVNSMLPNAKYQRCMVHFMDVFHISSHKTSSWLLIAAALLLWLVSALELRLTNELFLVTAGFFPIAFFAFALSNAAIYSTFWKHCPGWLSTAMTGLASYSYGIYMVHLIIAQVLRALIPDSMHLLRVASLNTVSILLFSLLAVFVIARIHPLRKWLLLIK